MWGVWNVRNLRVFWVQIQKSNLWVKEKISWKSPNHCVVQRNFQKTLFHSCMIHWNIFVNQLNFMTVLVGNCQTEIQSVRKIKDIRSSAHHKIFHIPHKLWGQIILRMWSHKSFAFGLMKLLTFVTNAIFGWNNFWHLWTKELLILIKRI